MSLFRILFRLRLPHFFMFSKLLEFFADIDGESPPEELGGCAGA